MRSLRIGGLNGPDEDHSSLIEYFAKAATRSYFGANNPQNIFYFKALFLPF